jgi:hypothetical protein
MTRAAKHGVIWWIIWAAVLAGLVALMAFLWRSDKHESDRIALVATAMSVVGVLIATVALKWTRDAVIIADRAMRAEILYEEMQRLEMIAGAINDSLKDAEPSESSTRLAKALGGLHRKVLPDTFALADSYERGEGPAADLVTKAIGEVTEHLEAKLLARTSLTGQ